MAKLRVEWIVAGWAPGVRTILRSILFHSMTGLTGCEVESASAATAWDKPGTEVQRPTHRSAAANDRFAMGRTSLFGFSENARAGPDYSCSGRSFPLPVDNRERANLFRRLFLFRENFVWVQLGFERVDRNRTPKQNLLFISF